MTLLVAGLALGIGAVLVWRRDRAPSPALGVFTLYLLGGSTALGDPYAPRADLGKIVGLLLENQVLGRPLRVVNLAGRGQAAAASIAAAERIARARHEPRSVAAFLYLGNNEFLGFDRRHDLQGRPRRLFDAPVVTSEEKDEVLRRYERSIDRILQILATAEVAAIAATAAVNLADWEPNRSVLADSTHAEVVATLLRQSEESRRAGDLLGALRCQREILAVEPTFALASKLAGDLCRALGDTQQAFLHYRNAADNDGNPYRELSRQDEILRTVCRRRGVPVVEAGALLAAGTTDGLLGYELLWDNCHPTLAGYLRLAAGFATALCAALELPPPPPGPGPETVATALGIDATFQRQVLHERAQYCYGAATLTYAPQARLARARHYLEQAARLGPEDADITCSFAVLAALEGDLEASLTHWRRANALAPDVARGRASNRYVAQIMRRHGVEDLLSMLR